VVPLGRKGKAVRRELAMMRKMVRTLVGKLMLKMLRLGLDLAHKVVLMEGVQDSVF